MVKGTNKRGSSGQSGGSAKGAKDLRIWKNKKAQQNRLIKRIKKSCNDLVMLKSSVRFLLVMDDVTGTPGIHKNLYVTGSKRWYEWAMDRASKLKDMKKDDVSRLGELVVGKASSQKKKGAESSRVPPRISLDERVRIAYSEPKKSGLTTPRMFKLTSALAHAVKLSSWCNKLPGNLESFRGMGIDLGEKVALKEKIQCDAWNLLSTKGWKNVSDIPDFPTTEDSLNKNKRYVTFDRLVAMTPSDAKNKLYPTAQWAIAGLILESVRPGDTIIFSPSPGTTKCIMVQV